MKLEKLGLTVIALSLATGSTPNMSYAMESKKQALTNGNYHIITPRIICLDPISFGV